MQTCSELSFQTFIDAPMPLYKFVTCEHAADECEFEVTLSSGTAGMHVRFVG